MITRVQAIPSLRGRRVLVTSDLHAHGDLFRELLAKAAYIPGRDFLVVCGDMLEKGPGSLDTLRFLMSLHAQGNVFPMVGNADLLLHHLLTAEGEDRQKKAAGLLRYRSIWKRTAFDEACDELGIRCDHQTDFEDAIPRVRSHLEKELAFLDQLPTIVHSPEMIFVHAFLPHEEIDALEGTDNTPYVKTDDFYSKAQPFRRWVVAGHWPVSLSYTDIMSANPLEDTRRHLICIDGGCGVKRTGQLNMLVINEDFQFSYLSADDHPQITALESQPAGSGPVHYIRWTDRFIESERTEGDISRIVFHGHEMTVPALFVSRNPWDGLICDDVSDAQLAVEKGDRLFLIQETSCGVFCRKDGVCGWYYGKYSGPESSDE